jgi:outer membrane protein insertion porin family
MSALAVKMIGSGGSILGCNGYGRGQISATLAGVLACFLMVMVAAPVMAQSYTFGAVRIEGNERIETETILTYVGIARGETVTAGDLNAAAQSLRGTGLFESVDVIPEGGTLVIAVQEYPTINQINFEGNARLKDEDLAAVIGSVPNRVFNPSQVEDDVSAITQAYVIRGRINATVTPSIIRLDDNQVNLVFEVFEGAVTEVERISFVGNRAYSELRLRGVLETKQAGFFRTFIQRDTFDAQRLDFDKQVLTDFYNSRGYADFRILNVDVALTRERDAYLITYNLQEGQQFRVGSVTVSSQIPEADAQLFMDAVRLNSGQVYSPVLIDNDIERLEDLASDIGINFLRVDPVITRDERGGILNVDYSLVRGERIFVERIDIEGNTTTVDRVIRDQFTSVEGDPFNPRAIRDSAERIRALGYFSVAEIEARPGSTPDQVVIDVNVEEAPTGSLSFGANYSTDNGFGLLASYTEENFLGRGQYLNLEISTSQNNRVFTFDFAEPRFLGRDLTFGFELGYQNTFQDYAVYNTETFRFAPRFSFPIGENSALTLYVAAEATDITDVEGEPTDPPDERASLIIFNEADEGVIWNESVGYAYTWDTVGTGVNPDNGLFFRFGQEFAGGDTTFVKTTSVLTGQLGVLGEAVTLIGTVEGGMLYYIEGSSRVTDRFFLGGQTLRGFQPNGIGPRDASTLDALGGDAFAVARLEANFPLGLPEEYGMMGGVFFDYGSVWDVGNITPESPDQILYNDFTPRSVIGLSLFWNTPLGPLRFNFSQALQYEAEDETRFFDLTVSTAF